MSRSVVLGSSESTIDLLLDYLYKQVQLTIPDSPYKDFYLWALSADNPHQHQWLETIGLYQFVHLSHGLLDGLVPQPLVGALLQRSFPMNTYLLFETISDNLAFGCAPWCDLPFDHHRERRQMLLAFNADMVRRIQHATDKPASYQDAYPWQDAALRFSSLAQSMSAHKQQASIEAYLQQHPHVHLHDIEYGTWVLLAANIENCVAVAGAVHGHLLQPLLADTLAKRYEGVTYLLEHRNLKLDDLLQIGTHTILVMTVLTYYSACLADLLKIDLAPVVNNGLIERVFSQAALLIRLLNDIGTSLLRDDDLRQDMLDLARLAHETRPEKYDTVYSLLLNVARGHVTLTRLQKDIQFGEFNILLHNLMPIQHDITQALDVFEQHLTHCAELYTHTRGALLRDMASLESALGRDAFGELAWRFVMFHEQLYSHSFLSNDGEYAV